MRGGRDHDIGYCRSGQEERVLYFKTSVSVFQYGIYSGGYGRRFHAEEAESLIRQIPEIPLITIANDKLLEQEYKNCLKACNCQDLIRIIKTIYLRKRAREEAGRKETAVDARYFRIAEDQLYGELAVALDMSRENVESYINTSLQSV